MAPDQKDQVVDHKRKFSTTDDTVFGPATRAGKMDTATTPTTATKPTATKPTATKPTATKPTATKPIGTAPIATTPVATAPIATTPTATKPTVTAPTATTPTAPKPIVAPPVVTPPITAPPVVATSTVAVPTGVGCNATLLTKCLFTYKLACDVIQYGITVDTAKKLSYVDLHARVGDMQLQDVMKLVVRNIAVNCRGIKVAERDRTVTFVMSTGFFVNSFLIAHHPVEHFRIIGEAERHVIKKAVEMLSSLEDILRTIRTISPGCDFTKEFLTVEEKSCIFLHIFQMFMDAHDNVRNIQMERVISTYKRSTSVIVKAQQSVQDEGAEGFKLRCVKRQREMDERLKVVVGTKATKIIHDHHTALLGQRPKQPLEKTTATGATWTPWLGV